MGSPQYPGAPARQLPSGCTGFALRGLDITIPSDVDLVDCLAVLWSMIPWATALCLVVSLLFFVRHSLRSFLAAAYLSIVMIVNEGLLKRTISQPRPLGTCLATPGMPSSHAAVAVGLCVYMTLELRLHRLDWSHAKRARWSLASWLIFLPVPFSRVHLKDHSEVQVLVGGFVGAVVAILWVFQCRRWARRHYFEKWTSSFLGKKLKLRNDYGYPAGGTSGGGNQCHHHVCHPPVLATACSTSPQVTDSAART